jgi:hypothetical protein
VPVVIHPIRNILAFLIGSHVIFSNRQYNHFAEKFSKSHCTNNEKLAFKKCFSYSIFNSKNKRILIVLNLSQFAAPWIALSTPWKA